MTLQQIFSSKNFDENPFTFYELYTALRENGFSDLSSRILTTSHDFLSFSKPIRKDRFKKKFRFTAGAGSDLSIYFGSENTYIDVTIYPSTTNPKNLADGNNDSSFTLSISTKVREQANKLVAVILDCIPE